MGYSRGLAPVPDTSESAENMISPRPMPVLMLKLIGIIRIVRIGWSRSHGNRSNQGARLPGT